MLVEVPYSYVRTYQKVAAREHVSISETKQTRWFRADRHEGFCGLIEVSRDTLRIKGVFVHPEYRGTGIGTQMTEELIQKAATYPHRRLEVLAYNPAFYEQRGFTRRAKLRNGAWRLIKE